MNLPEDRPSVDIQATVAAANAIAAADAARAEGKTKGKKKKLSKDDKANDLRAAIKMDEHYIPFDELYTRFGVDVKTGLTDKQVKKKAGDRGHELPDPAQGKARMAQAPRDPERIFQHPPLGGCHPLLYWVRPSTVRGQPLPRNRAILCRDRHRHIRVLSGAQRVQPHGAVQEHAAASSHD
jgi:hypothetical protein